MDYRKLVRSAKDYLKDNVVVSTAILSVSNPLFAVFELDVAKMSHATSINAKGLAALITYGGMGLVFDKGRDLSRRLFKVNEKSKGITQGIHDSLYSLAYNAVICPPFYYLCGSRDIKEIAAGTGIGMAFALGSGWITGISVDTYKDLLGIHKSLRISRKISNAKRPVKLGLAALLTASSIALTSMVYVLTPDKKDNDKGQNQRTEQSQNIAPSDSLESVLIQK